MKVLPIGKSMSIGFVIITLACMILFVSAYDAQSAETIKIGIVLSTTGHGASIGTAEKEAIEIEIERINKQGGIFGRQLEAYYENDQSDPANAANAATKLIRDKGVSTVIGTTLTYACMAMLPICEKEGVVNVSLSPGYEITNPLKKWVFRIPATDQQLSQLFLAFASKKLGAKNIALLHTTDSQGISGAKGIIDNVKKYNMNIVITEKLDSKDTNMTLQLTKIKAARPDAIILWASSAPATVIAKNYNQLRMEKIPVIGAHSIGTTDFVKNVGKLVEDGRWIFLGLKGYIADKLPPDDPYRKNVHDPFMQALRKKYGENKKYSPFHGNGYDGVHAVAAALRIAGTDNRAALRDAMEKITFAGFQGEFKYTPTDHDGQDVVKNRIPVILKNGNFWPYK
jgi:branched-chain amino acid transport system substrate-binding protein